MGLSHHYKKATKSLSLD